MVTRPTSVFKDARLRIKWAKENVGQFERIAKRYFRSAPCTRIIKPEPDGINERHCLKLLKPLPESLTKNAIKAVENLRSALDLTATSIARLCNLPSDGVYFPFCKTSNDFKSRIGSCCKDFPEEITRLWEGYEPYGRADNLLFAINEICNSSKHRIIVPVARKAGIAMPYLETSSATKPITIFEGSSIDEEDEITFAITERGLQWKYHVQMAVGISFGDIGEASGREVKPNLDAMIGCVMTIVNETETECRTIGLI